MSSSSQIPISLPPQQDVLKDVPKHITDLLDRLHQESLHQESKLSKDAYGSNIADTMRDKFIALDQDKSQFIYTLCRALDARTIVEAGTSFGVSTIYLALAAAANAEANAGQAGRSARVIATEHEPSKAERARQYWRECGDVVSQVIDLREGDLRETLKTDVEDVDLLLLDIWTPMALPTLKIVQPKLRRGAAVITDNTIGSVAKYQELLEHLRGPESPFINLTLPYNKGLELSIYLPH